MSHRLDYKSVNAMFDAQNFYLCILRLVPHQTILLLFILIFQDDK